MRRTDHRGFAVGFALTLALAATVAFTPWGSHVGVTNANRPSGQKCVDESDDPAGCQPSTFDTPVGDIPGGRVDGRGRLDPYSSKEEAMKGARAVEKKLGLFRNFEDVHWVPTVPSAKDPETDKWKGGDLEAQGDARGIGIASNCIYVGHSNGSPMDESGGGGAGAAHPVNIFKIQKNPEKDPPVQVGTIPAFPIKDPENDREIAADDREVRAIEYTSTDGKDRMLVVRDSTMGQSGNMTTYTVDPRTCLPTDQTESYVFGGELHEFFLWQDPKNANRILVFTQMWSGGEQPDPYNAGSTIPDMEVMAITDEKTGEVLKTPQVLAGFTLQDVGGPLHVENPDTTGLYSDGRFPDYSNNKDSWGRAGAKQTSQWNRLHNASVLPDGERVYVANGTAGFYVLNSEAVAHHTNAELLASKAGCRKYSTNVWQDGVADDNNDGIADGHVVASKLSELANDCLHMVINDDPGVKALLSSNASSPDKLLRYQRLLDRSRFDPEPSGTPAFTGVHSGIFIPNRPSQARGNTKDRPAFVWTSDENNLCPLQYSRMVSIESEANPTMIGAFALPDNKLEECLTQSTKEPDGTQKKSRVAQQNHNPTVFKNLVFNTWYGHGLRAIDISNPYTPREVGYAVTAPWGNARSYPVFKDGLIYWTDNSTGLRVAKYTGPRANELPGRGSGVYEGNSTPHR